MDNLIVVFPCSEWLFGWSLTFYCRRRQSIENFEIDSSTARDPIFNFWKLTLAVTKFLGQRLLSSRVIVKSSGQLKRIFFSIIHQCGQKARTCERFEKKNMWEESRTRRNLLMTLRTTPGAALEETKASRLKQPLLVTLNYAFSSRLKYVAVFFSAFICGGKSDKKLVSKTKLNHSSKLHKFNSAFLRL